MEGEINNFILVWISVLASLCYCHTIGKIIPKGTTRLLIISPVVCLFLILPLNLSSIYFIGAISFCITWLGNFKLLLFAFDQGPLSSHPPISLSRFILLASLPIKIQHHHPSPQILEKPQTMKNKAYPSPQITKKGQKSLLNYATKGLLLGIVVRVCDYREFIHPKVILLLYCLEMYCGLEIGLVMLAALARALLRLELEPQFDEPYLSTSLQDFWGRRWNLMVTGILRPTVYDPVRSVSSRLIGRKRAPLPGILATFLVSALMHELIYFQLGRVKPTWEVTCFFLLHGVCLAVEITIKKALLEGGKLRLPAVVSGPLAVGFVVITGIWLFFPPLVRCEVDVRLRNEFAALIEFVGDIVGRCRFYNVVSR